MFVGINEKLETLILMNAELYWCTFLYFDLLTTFFINSGCRQMKYRYAGRAQGRGKMKEIQLFFTRLMSQASLFKIIEVTTL